MRLKKSFVIPFFTALGTAAYADNGMGNDWDFGHMWGGGYGMSGGLMMVLFWGVVIALIVVAVRRHGTGTGKPDQDPAKILKERFARGEIDEDEYRKRLATLNE
ncbi:SHOCT domain-containing protein [Octadecabacter sp. R77987]|uniref:SHOCT domain-containing protein n=1 Tax=Octadecabacter sp. R77987 TaxID=3093874 RepID=UPI00366D3BE5